MLPSSVYYKVSCKNALFWYISKLNGEESFLELVESIVRMNVLWIKIPRSRIVKVNKSFNHKNIFCLINNALVIHHNKSDHNSIKRFKYLRFFVLLMKSVFNLLRWECIESALISESAMINFHSGSYTMWAFLTNLLLLQYEII